MELKPLEERLQYRFHTPRLLEEALRHRSWVNEQEDRRLRDNERLEFLGDAVLGLAIGDLLMRRYPKIQEGQLSRLRAALVNEAELARLANRLELGRYLMLGKGEILTDGRRKQSILADAMEAVTAAVYLDGGFEAALQVVANQFKDRIEAKAMASGDPKSRLQEIMQVAHLPVPRYELVEAAGPDHDKTFRVKLTVAGLETIGVGKNKKTAQQDAARQALSRLDPPDSEPT